MRIAHLLLVITAAATYTATAIVAHPTASPQSSSCPPNAPSCDMCSVIGVLGLQCFESDGSCSTCFS